LNNKFHIYTYLCFVINSASLHKISAEGILLKKRISVSRKHKEPTAAPGFDDSRFGEKATEEEIRTGKSTKVTRVYLDENDPS
jgi:hypothetical protein